MLSGLINQSHFLQAVGWAILHSLWQTAFLWLLFKAITTGNQNASSAFKYNLGLFCLTGSLVWFLLTGVNQYSALENDLVLPVNYFVLKGGAIPVLSENILPAVSVIYLLLLMFYVLQFGRQYILLYGFRNANLIKAPVEIRLFTQQAAYRLGIKKEVGCWLSAKVDAPFVTGFFRPVILLPFSLLNHLTMAQAEAVILHELAHVKRNDYLVNIFQLIAEKLLFFNPFARLLNEAVRAEREHCCDDWVINFRFNQHEYAHALLQVEQLRNQQLLLAVNATSGKKKLLVRIKRIFSAAPATKISGGQKIKLIITAVSMLVTLVLLVPVAKNLTIKPVPVATIHPASVDLAILKEQNFAAKETGQPIIKTEQEIGRMPSVKEKPSLLKTDPVKTSSVEPASTIMINEELLETPVEQAATAIQVSDQPAAKTNVLMVRVEEEVGGSREKKVYYVQLNNTNGQTEVKPLAFVKEPLPDSLKTLTKTAKITQTTSKRLFSKKSKTI